MKQPTHAERDAAHLARTTDPSYRLTVKRERYVDHDGSGGPRKPTDYLRGLAEAFPQHLDAVGAVMAAQHALRVAVEADLAEACAAGDAERTALLRRFLWEVLHG